MISTSLGYLLRTALLWGKSAGVVTDILHFLLLSVTLVIVSCVLVLVTRVYLVLSS